MVDSFEPFETKAYKEAVVKLLASLGACFTMFFSRRFVVFFPGPSVVLEPVYVILFVTTYYIGDGLTKVWAYCRYARPLRESKTTPTTRRAGWIMDVSKMEL